MAISSSLSSRTTVTTGSVTPSARMRSNWPAICVATKRSSSASEEIGSPLSSPLTNWMRGSIASGRISAGTQLANGSSTRMYQMMKPACRWPITVGSV